MEEPHLDPIAVVEQERHPLRAHGAEERRVTLGERLRAGPAAVVG
jgi:hypothetical protein